MLPENELYNVLAALPLGLLLVLPDAPVFTVVMANDCFLGTAGLQPGDVVGKGLFEVLALGQADGLDAQCHNQLNCSLDCVLQLNQRHRTRLPDYPAALGAAGRGPCSVEHIPLLDDDGKIRFILHAPARLGGSDDKGPRPARPAHDGLLDDVRRMNAHEIRRPLANILGTLDLISACREEHDRVPQEYLDFLYFSAAQLDQMVRDVIDLINGRDAGDE